MDEEPVCDCGDEPPDPDPGCCGSDTCEENETCCNETTCVLTSSFQTDSSNCGGCGNVCPAGQTCVNGACTGPEDTCPPGYVSCGATGGVFILDSDVEWTWVSNDGCPEGCVAFKDEQPTAEEEAAGLTPGDFSYDGICCRPEPCESANCGARRYKWVYGNVFANPYYSGGSWALTSGCNADGEDYICSPSNSTPPGPILGSCGGAFAAYHAWLCREPGQIPGVDCQASGPHEIIGSGPCFDVDCTCESSVGGLSVPSDKPVEVTESPCSQEECEAHVSTWMAEPIGEPNEEGLYKVKWILLDDCPGECCSDQPTQPEFVKTSTLVDAPCKCDCN